VSTKDLISLLFDLSKSVINKFSEYLSSEKIRIVKRLYSRNRVEEFNYSKSGSLFRSTTEHIARDELDFYTLHEFIKDLGKEDLYKRVKEVIVELYNAGEVQADFWLERFIEKLIDKYYSGRLVYKELAYLINTFINEIEDNPIDWHIEVWLKGIFLEVPMIELEKGAVLRAPCKEDLEYDPSSRIPPPPTLTSMEAPFIPDAIIEINKRLKIRPAIYPYKEKLIILLQLYKLCSVHEVGTRWFPQGVLSFASTTQKPERLQTTYKCVLNGDDAKRLPNFIKGLESHIPFDEKLGRILVDNYIGVALSRYQDGLLKPEPIPNKIAYAIFGLEALYLKGEERGELKQRLALRVARVLSKLNVDSSKNILDNVKRAYNIRSAFVHGEPLKSNRYQDRNLLDRIAEYLRISLLLFMQVSIEKDKLIDLIDDSLIDEDSDRKLKQVIETIHYL